MATFGNLARFSSPDHGPLPEDAASTTIPSAIASDGAFIDVDVSAFVAVANHHPILPDQSAGILRKMLDAQCQQICNPRSQSSCAKRWQCPEPVAGIAGGKARS